MSLGKYLKESRAELNNVTWPTSKQIGEGTQASLLFLIALTSIIYLFDFIFNAFMKLVLS